MHCWWKCKLVKALWKTLWRFLINLKIELAFDPVIPLLSICPEKKMIFKKTHALQCSKQHYLQQPGHGNNHIVYMSINRELKIQYIHTMEHYSAIERNEIGSFAEMQIDLKKIIQSEVSQKEKSKYCALMHICGIQKNGIDDHTCKAETETQMQRTNVWIPRGEEKMGGIGRLGSMHIHH